MTGPRPELEDAIELLERSLAYTRGALMTVADADLSRPTPCASWDLDQLLEHMDDALDAFVEGAGGDVGPTATPRAAGSTAGERVRVLQDKACALLGAWSGDLPDVATLGTRALTTALLARAAALEIAVHGWDVAHATGTARAIPEGLARPLLATAQALVDRDDRGVRFAPARSAQGATDPESLLLAYLGRTRPHGT